MMSWWSGPGGGAGWPWPVVTLLFIAGAVLIVAWAVGGFGSGADDEPARSLRASFARGEIDAAEFDAQRQLLGSGQPRAARDRLGLIGLLLLVAALIAWIAGGIAAPGGRADWSWGPIGPGMMGGVLTGDEPGPGAPGFVAGTPGAPRVVHVFAGPGYSFSPSDVRIVAGETITFEVTTMGPSVHEFKVGPAAEVAADADSAPEIADIGMMETRSLTYTFTGSGPFAFACHEPGHYEAGMRGTITVVS